VCHEVRQITRLWLRSGTGGGLLAYASWLHGDGMRFPYFEAPTCRPNVQESWSEEYI
jgi:hypothetical protein